MSANIKITFATEGGKDYTLTIGDCPNPLQTSAVKNGIKDILDSGALVTPYGKPVFAKKAMLYVPDIRDYDVKEI